MHETSSTGQQCWLAATLSLLISATLSLLILATLSLLILATLSLLILATLSLLLLLLSTQVGSRTQGNTRN